MRLALALALAASGAWAECPTASDLAGGIRLRWSDGDVTTIRSTDDPMMLRVRDEWPASDPDRPGTAYRVQSVAWGLYPVEDTEVEGTEFDWLVSVDYGIEPGLLPRPTTASEVRFAEVVHHTHWPMWMRETYRMGPPGIVTLASCPYRAFQVVRSSAFLPPDTGPPGQPEADPGFTQGWAYLTDLGFAVESWFGPPEDRILAPDVVAIEAVRP